MSINTLSCAGISTLVGLYKSRPTDFGVARVGIHAAVIVSCKGALWLPYLLFLVILYFAQLIYPFYLSTMKYLVTCTILQCTHIRVYKL